MSKRKQKKKISARSGAKTKKKPTSAKKTKPTASKLKRRSTPKRAKPRKTESKPRARAKANKPSKPAQNEEPAVLIPVPLPGGVVAQRPGDVSERSAHLEKLKQLFETAPVSRYLGMALGYCENGVARVRLPFRKEFVDGNSVIHGGLIGLLGDTAGNFAVGSVSPGSNVKTVEFKLSLLSSVQGDLLAIGEVVRKGRTLATCRLEVVEGNDRVVAIGLATYALQAI